MNELINMMTQDHIQRKVSQFADHIPSVCDPRSVDYG